MNKLKAIDNKLNYVTCPKMIDSLIYERKSVEINWKAKAEELRQEELRLEAEKEARQGLLNKLKRFFI